MLGVMELFHVFIYIHNVLQDRTSPQGFSPDPSTLHVMLVRCLFVPLGAHP